MRTPCGLGSFAMLVALVLAPVCRGADSLATVDGLGGRLVAERPADLDRVVLGGVPLPGVSVQTRLRLANGDQSTDLTRMSVAGTWRAVAGRLVLDGVVTATGTSDCIADLVVRVTGVTIPTGTMAAEPLLLPKRLLGKLPIVSLRTGGDDCLALGVPPDALAEFRFVQDEAGAELHFPLGFTADGPEDLRMRAPFRCTLYRTEPTWHFRSALARYYAFFPEPFRVFLTPVGGWFFAAPTKDLPNPQHFYFHEGGPNGHGLDQMRGLGTYPYRESSSLTIHLPGTEQPRDYAEAMVQLHEMEKESDTIAAAWSPMRVYALDSEVAHGGKRSIRAQNAKVGGWAGARQAVVFDKPVNEPFAISGWSKAQEVSGTPDHSYAVYVDVIHADGSALFGQCAMFATGTHDWERAELVVTPAKPVAELRVYCLLRYAHTGTAWFDDLRIGPVRTPDVNWLDNADFEEPAPGLDLTFLRDNVCHNAQDQWVMRITDNVSADVGPKTPMNLLRFTLNVAPDLPSRDGHQTVAEREFALFDRLCRDVPGIEGLYIDSVSAWCSRVLNVRRQHWTANTVPFTYDPGTRRVAVSGRFGMRDYLARLQDRYHPRGKAIFTNIHCSHEAFPLYLVSDIPGIESSRFNSEDDLFFYRACSYRKPLLLMNFMNLHGLDKRDVAETFHLNAAFWGELPSTGRYVQRAYREYGDVTHALLPAIRELAVAGWQPIPLCTGSRAERFGHGLDAVFFTVRAGVDGSAALQIADQALRPLGRDLVAFDTVWLRPRRLARHEDGWRLDLTDSVSGTAVIRIMPERGVAPWLLQRAAEHARAAARVRSGTTGMTAPLRRAIDSVERLAEDGVTFTGLALTRAVLTEAAESSGHDPEDLFALSERRELLQARHALGALALHAVGAGLAVEVARPTVAGKAFGIRAVAEPRLGTIRSNGILREAGWKLVPDWAAEKRSEGNAAPAACAPGRYTVRAQFEVAAPGCPPFLAEQVAFHTVRPAARLVVTGNTIKGDRCELVVGVEDNVESIPLVLQTDIDPPLPRKPVPVPVAPGPAATRIAFPLTHGGVERAITVSAVTSAGVPVAQVQTHCLDEPPLPAAPARVPIAACRTDSSYSGYSPEVLVDGVIKTADLHWTKRAWASKDGATAHWIQLDLAKPQPVAGVMVYWNREVGRSYAASRYRVVLLTETGEQVVKEVTESSARTMDRHEWQPIQARAIRIEQSPRGGPGHRPGIMWVREVQVLR